MPHEILIVDDEADIRTQIAGILEDVGYEARQASNSSEALEVMAGRQPALVVLDVWLGDSELDGLETLAAIRRDYPDQQVVMISGHATFDMAVTATKMGAYDFITKPFKADVLIHTVERSIHEMRLRQENQELRRRSPGTPEDIVGTSQVMVQLRKLIEKVGPTDSRVLINGPTGSGKSMIARTLHQLSPRSGGRFEVVNCSTVEPAGRDGLLFGHEAESGRPRQLGLFERAHRGTLVLEEVAELSPEAQARIVAFLHDGAFRRAGGRKAIEADVRILATSRRDLRAEIAAGCFHEELYYRLNVVPIEIPPLRERRKDIAALARHVMSRIAADHGRPARTISADGIAALEAYNWPGNLWELSNVIERLLLTTPGDTEDTITGDHVAQAIGQDARGAGRWDGAIGVLNQPLREAREAFEREYLIFHLTRFGGNISRTAEFVGMDRAALHRKLKLLGLNVTARAQEAGA